MPTMRLRARIIGQRNAGADADFEDAPADALGRRDRRLAAALEHLAEHEIVDRRPARIGLGDRALVELARHRSPRLIATFASYATRDRAPRPALGAACAASRPRSG